MVRSPTVDKNGLKRGAWSEEEDNKLRAYIKRYGHWNWRQLPRFAGLKRCGKSCRLRWLNYLRPGLKKGSYSKEEEEMIIKLREELGNKWSLIAAKLPGRTDNEIKNYWHTNLRKSIKQDPTSTEKTTRRCNNYSMSLSESTDQTIEWAAEIAAADASIENISPSSHNYSTLLGGAENSFSSEESFPKFFANFWTEPFFPNTSYNQILSSTSFTSIVSDLEDWVIENGITLEESFLKTSGSFLTEPVSSYASNGLISPFTSCNSTVTNSGESSADTFCSFWTEPIFSNASDDAFGNFQAESFSLDTSYNQSIHQLAPVEEDVMLPFNSTRL